MGLTFDVKLCLLSIAIWIPSPVSSPIPETRKLPIEVIEMNEKTKAQDEPTKRTCSGAYLAMPDEVLPYSAYPFMLHEMFALSWNIHIVDHCMSIQSLSCTGVREELSESCQGCSQLLTHRIVKAILHQMKNGIHINTNYAYQPIGGLIEVLHKKSAVLDGLRFKQLLTSQTMARQAQTVGQYEQ